MSGIAGFGGGDGALGQGGSGGGFGGALFVRSGKVMLSQVQFEGNRAISGSGHSPGLGKGGAIFVMPRQLQPDAAAKVIVLGEPLTLIDNWATDAADLPTDSNDIYGALRFEHRAF